MGDESASILPVGGVSSPAALDEAAASEKPTTASDSASASRSETGSGSRGEDEIAADVDGKPPASDSPGLYAHPVGKTEGFGTQLARTKAVEVAKKLLWVYRKRENRKRHYKDLFLYLFFVAFYFSVLYFQRDSPNTFAVTSSIYNGFVPSDATFYEVQGVYDWLSGFVSSSWVDPVCGDGKCETPFEYPYYGHFGCKADCGEFKKLFNVTDIVVDLAYDFSHPPGSIPSSTIFLQAAWNVCPFPGFPGQSSQAYLEEPPHGLDCYFQEDQQFPKETGTSQVLIDDIPNGDWQLVVRGDMFRKVRGAVRFSDDLLDDVVDTKVALARYSTTVAAFTEFQRLNQTLHDLYFPTAVQLVFNNNLQVFKATRDMRTALAQFAVATPFCYSFASNATLSKVNGLTNQGVSRADSSTTPPAMPAEIMGTGCRCVLDGNRVPTPPCACDNSTALACQFGFSNVTQAISDAERAIGSRLAKLEADTLTGVNNVVHNRLGEIAFVNSAVAANISSASGLNVTDVASVNMQTLSADYVARVWSADASKTELRRVTSTASSSPMVLKAAIDQRMAVLLAAGADVLPETPVDSTIFEDVLTEFDGGKDQYLTCDLETRAPEYYGECVSMSSEEHDADFLAPTGSLSEGVVALCGVLCDCSPDAQVNGTKKSIAETWPCGGAKPPVPPQDGSPLQPGPGSTLPGTYPGDYFCICPACQRAAEDLSDSIGGRKLLGLQRAGDPVDHPNDFIEHHGRRLQQSTNTMDLIAQAVRDLGAQQAAMSSAATAAAGAQAAAASTLAGFQRDKTLANAVTSGFSSLQTAHMQISTQLDTALGLSTTQLAQATQAAQALQTQQALVEARVAALAAVEAAVLAQLDRLQDAYRSGKLNTTRLDRLRLLALLSQQNYTKQSVLANRPCTVTAAQYTFSLNRSSTIYEPTASRKRLVGLSNRIVGGLLLYTTRRTVTECDGLYGGMASSCEANRGALNTNNFGVDPAFKFGTSLFNSDLSDPMSQDTAVLLYYNCSDPAQVSPPQPTNPYCDSLFDQNRFPHGFRHTDTPGFSDGFPVFVENNLSQEQAARLMTYLQEGLFLDPLRTKKLTAILLTYNGELEYFCLSRVEFDFEGGAIHVSHSTNSLRLDLYSGSEGDNLRLAGEIILAVLIMVSLAVETLDLVETTRAAGTVAAYFASFWNYIDVASLAIFVATTVIWWSTYFKHTSKFSPSETYDVYENNKQPANFLTLADGGRGLDQAALMYSDVTTIVGLYQLYAALHGINIVLSLLRMLKLMDFQPRLGVITRTVFEAAADLGHFFFVLLVFFFNFTMIAHLMFGFYTPWFSDLPTAINTSFTTILGDFSWFPFVQAPPGVQGILGAAYFWIYETVMVLVLLNFLLAIICEAFNQAKMAATDNTSVAEEIRVLAMEYWHRLTDRNYVSDTAVLRQLKVWSGRHADSDLDTDEEEEGGQRLRSVNSQARHRHRGREKALKISDNTFVTQDELEDIVGMCIRESATESALLEVNMSESAKRRLADEAADNEAPALADALFQRCAEEIKNAGSSKEEEQEELIDEAELAANEHYRAVNEALGKLMAVHHQLLQGHLVVTENQRKVDHASRSVARINADLGKLFAARGRRRGGAGDAGRRYSTHSLVPSSQARASMAQLKPAVARQSVQPSTQRLQRDASKRGESSVRKPPPVATSGAASGGAPSSASGSAHVSPADIVTRIA